ncbi:hypothetical protein PT974_07465 [Cladobotryum mycophilum]|uniref:Uncharacterized protein n=1 Tax=Cladobotryum mycophilum TaxID=491253 RepID=A0ABR0SQL9_9HYPO
MFIPPQLFIPQDSIKLGRFITSIENPHESYHDPECAGPAKAVIVVRETYTGVHETTSHSSFGSSLTSLLSTQFSKRAKKTVRVIASQVTTSMLDNSDSWFEEATRIPATQTWIERQVDQGHDIFLIVGLHTVTDASIMHESSLGKSYRPKHRGEHQAFAGAQSQFVVPGDQVCALQCRRISHRWLSSRHVEQFRLKRPRWKSLEMSRDDEEDEDDTIEVDMIEGEGLGEGWDREAIGDDIVFVASVAEAEP